MTKTIDDFPKGVLVNVKRLEGDQFNHNFTGHVVNSRGNNIVVEDQDGDCWECELEQISYSSDEIMHADSCGHLE